MQFLFEAQRASPQYEHGAPALLADSFCPVSVGRTDSKRVPKLVGIRYFPDPLGIDLAVKFQFEAQRASPQYEHSAPASLPDSFCPVSILP